MNLIKIDKNYQIEAIKYFFIKKKYLITYSIDDSNIHNHSKEFIKKLQLFDADISAIKQSYLIIFHAYPCLEVCNFEIIDVFCSNNSLKRLLLIHDIGIYKKYRGKGLGSQIMAIIERIARNNSVNFIQGELQEDRIGEPLNKRKNFFEQHGFSLWLDKRSSFSGWLAKKTII